MDPKIEWANPAVAPFFIIHHGALRSDRRNVSIIIHYSIYVAILPHDTQPDIEVIKQTKAPSHGEVRRRTNVTTL